MEKKKLGVAGVISIVFAGLNAIGLIVTVGLSLHIRGVFAEMFADFGATLPAITQMVLDIHWMLAIGVAAPFFVILVAKEFITKKWIPLLINGVYVLLGIVYWVVFQIVMLIPVMEIGETIN